MGTAWLDVAVTKTATLRVLVLTTNARIRARMKEPVDQMRFASVRAIFRHALVHQVSKAILSPIRDVCEFLVYVQQLFSVQLPICVLETSATSPVKTPRAVPWVSVVLTMFALRFATPVTTVYQERCATRKECARPDVKPMMIVQRLRYVRIINANVELDSLEHRTAVQILMNVLKTCVTRLPDVKIHPDRLNAFAPRVQYLEELRDVCCPINATKTMNVIRVLAVSKANAKVHATEFNAVCMQLAM